VLTISASNDYSELNSNAEIDVQVIGTAAPLPDAPSERPVFGESRQESSVADGQSRTSETLELGRG
jgi:hypothetical protein